jgi:hypothetical protein
MKPYRRLLLATILIGVAALVYWFVVMRSEISYRNYRRIELGMLDVQVYRILGHPRDEPGHDPDLRFTEGLPARSETWRGRDFGVIVYFRGDGTVVYTECRWAQYLWDRPESWYRGYLIDWLGIDVEPWKIRE